MRITVVVVFELVHVHDYYADGFDLRLFAGKAKIARHRAEIIQPRKPVAVCEFGKFAVRRRDFAVVIRHTERVPPRKHIHRRYHKSYHDLRRYVVSRAAADEFRHDSARKHKRKHDCGVPRFRRPNPYQPRKYFSDEAIRELSSSIRQIGLLQPINVRQIGPERYEVIAGERRLR